MKDISKHIVQPVVLSGLLGLSLGFQPSAHAGVCNIKGQGLVVAYTMAEQGGYRSSAYYMKAKNGYNSPEKRRSGMYVVPGKLGVKGRTNGKQKIRAILFDNGRKKLRNGWRITRVNYGGSPTAVSSYIMNGTKIILTTRDRLSLGKAFDFYVTSFRMEHPSPSQKCGNDPISQQIALRKAFKG